MLLTLLTVLTILYVLHEIAIRLFAAILVILVLSVTTGCMQDKSTMEARPYEYTNYEWAEMRPL